MVFIDSETVGFHGPIVLLQYAIDDGPVELYSPWREPVSKTLLLIESMMRKSICGFNLSFDMFHLCQMYTTLLLLKDKEARPDIDEYVEAEPAARAGPCLKPVSACDVMLVARRGPYQSTMNRGDIRVKRIPTPIAWRVAEELTARIPLKDIYFAKRKDKSVRWQVFDIEDNPDFKDLVLKFSPSSALKALAVDTGVADAKTRLLYSDVEISKSLVPDDGKLGYVPFAKGMEGLTFPTWPIVIREHISHWAFNSLARKYAEDDVHDTRGLYKYFGSPEPGDDDSELACMVAACRWRGYAIDEGRLMALRQAAKQKVDTAPHNYNSVAVVRQYLGEVIDEVEATILEVNGKITTKATILEEISGWKQSSVCTTCKGMDEECKDCNDGLVLTDQPHPAALRAAEVLDYRKAKYEINTYDKLLLAGRFHADFNVIGTLSSRMSGGGGLNAQGIKHAKEVRLSFPLADGDLALTGGDFSGFEVCLADAVYKDPALRRDLESGKKIHALFGEFLFPGMTYEEILADQDIYSRSKQGVFCLLYMGNEFSLHNRVGISEQAAEGAYQEFIKRYRVFGREREKYAEMFCSMRQPGGIGSRVEWHEPDDFIESMFGFKRYFTLENQICKALYRLAEQPPKEWHQYKLKVVRRDREQTVSGSCRSALFAAAFAVQGSNMRAAGNHVIQSSGGQLTKSLQRRLWDLQPSGVGQWMVQPMNVHDEIMCPSAASCKEAVLTVVDEFVTEHRELVPLLDIEWSNGLSNWGEK